MLIRCKASPRVRMRAQAARARVRKRSRKRTRACALKRKRAGACERKPFIELLLKLQNGVGSGIVLEGPVRVGCSLEWFGWTLWNPARHYADIGFDQLIESGSTPGPESTLGRR